MRWLVLLASLIGTLGASATPAGCDWCPTGRQCSQWVRCGFGEGCLCVINSPNGMGVCTLMR